MCIKTTGGTKHGPQWHNLSVIILSPPQKKKEKKKRKKKKSNNNLWLATNIHCFASETGHIATHFPRFKGFILSFHSDRAQSTTTDYIRAKTNFVSSLLSTRVIKPKNTYIKHKIFEELVPSVLLLLQKHWRLGHAGIVDHSVDLSNRDFKNKVFSRKGMDRSNFFSNT